MKSEKQLARLAGLLYLIIAISGGFSIGYLPTLLVSTGDSTSTVQNILENQDLYKVGFVADSVVFLLEILLTIILYRLLKKVNKPLSMVALFSRMAMGVIMGMNLVVFAIPLMLLNGADYMSSFSPEQIESMVLFSLDMHQYGVYIWGLFFAVHLLVLGYLVFKAGFFPKTIGLLMLIGSFGYFGESLLGITFGESEIIGGINAVFLVFSVVGELSFTFWLLIKGIRSKSGSTAILD
jgi:hypothetical protein